MGKIEQSPREGMNGKARPDSNANTDNRQTNKQRKEKTNKIRTNASMIACFLPRLVVTSITLFIHPSIHLKPFFFLFFHSFFLSFIHSFFLSFSKQQGARKSRKRVRKDGLTRAKQMTRATQRERDKHECSHDTLVSFPISFFVIEVCGAP